jgi:putative membrane protein
MQNTTVIKEATFNPKVKTYIFLIVAFYLFITVIGWVLLPFWLFGLGQWLSGKFFKTLQCQLTNKHLKFSKGLILHIEKTIPLENIQDLSFIGGPILRAFGLTLIKVETAGGGGPHQSNMMSMPGIDDSEEFKNLILEQREKLIKEKHQGVSFSPVDAQSNLNSDKLLNDIKNELKEIKEVLKNQSKIVTN